ncbi:Transcription factor zinc-finger [Candidatus Electrothrix marina]|uniref:Transcription factor zinc-finger n=1 Tax=Candidatus Electrothrix marina TaxID=1859130 RepID=A0A444JFF8_9BACT|nr:Transcription factor zinc-finger [Candidatus Electrothrix marina]
MEKQCPCCNNVELRRTVRRGVEIDYCPDCNGIWLDNGELNKIVAESVQASATESSSAEISAEASRKSVFKSFLNLMGSTKDDADHGVEGIDGDFISESTSSGGDK